MKKSIPFKKVRYANFDDDLIFKHSTTRLKFSFHFVRTKFSTYYNQILPSRKTIMAEMTVKEL